MPTLCSDPAEKPVLTSGSLSHQGVLTQASCLLRVLLVALSKVGSIEHLPHWVHLHKRSHGQHLANILSSGPSCTAQDCTKGSDKFCKDLAGFILFIRHFPNSGDHNISFLCNLHYEPMGLCPHCVFQGTKWPYTYIFFPGLSSHFQKGSWGSSGSRSDHALPLAL